MSKEIYISSTPQETRLAIVEKDELTEIYYERENEYTLAGSIYNGRVTRVLPGMQSSFVDIGLERDAFLYITDFMEEAGDTADFEGGGEARSGRRDRPTERPTERSGERPAERGRGRREEGGAVVAEGTAPREESEGRQGEREERSRGGRHRRGDSGRSLPVAADEPKDDTLELGDEGRGELASREAGTESGRDAGTEAGEGAPGADASRRWRGRRGRRRGRGAGTEAMPVAGNDESSAQGSLAEKENDGFVPEPQDEARPEEFAREATPSRSTMEEPRREGRGRDRRRDERGRGEGDRERSPSRGSRRPSDDEGPLELNASASAEPFILPGESLGKYRKGGDDASGASASLGSQAAMPAMVARPSTEVEPIPGWDGGAVLPGETLSRHRGGSGGGSGGGSSSAAPESGGHGESRGQDRGDRGGRGERDGGGGRDRRRERDGRRGDSGRGESRPERGLTPAEAVQPGVTSQHEPEPHTLPFTEEAPQFAADAAEERFDPQAFERLDVPYETTTEGVSPDTQGTADVVLEAVEQFHEVVADYEPEDNAAASYRVDPSGPSEFRQAAPDTTGVVDVRFDEDSAIAQEGPTHEFTTVQGSGEMISEWPLVPEAGAEAANEAVTDNAPIEHEGAVQAVTLEEAEQTPQPGAFTEEEQDEVGSPESGMAGSMAAAADGEPGMFAPGDGDLEEELMDEEDGDLPVLTASAYDDDMEEETLEGTADLGSMIREMSIDQITAPEPAEMDNEDDDDDDYDIDPEELEEDELAADADLGGAEIEEDEAFSEAGGFTEEDFAEPAEAIAESEGEPARAEGRPEREGERSGRREGRRGGRDRDRGDRERGSRDKRGMGGSRNGGRPGRHSAQTTDLPAISDLLKPGQELLVQIAKEPIAKKGARITSHIALPGRFLVFMPTVNHVGVSRKIESDGERRRLKEILLSEKGEASGGFIVRTAASGASEEELRSDLRFLLNLWADIKQRSESSKSPALIYHDLNLVERILRDQVTDNFSAIWVDTETEYERVLRFLQRFQPSLIRRVKLYTKDTPLFEQFGITEEINKALRSKVWLKSGGSIVINQTEALVAIDINTGKYVGKTARLEDTIVKTNLDAIPEIVRQIRLRDLGGIIVIDFIDMDERKNRTKVLAALEEELKKDRAPSKVLQFNDFGLVAITRKRVKQSLERTLSTTCGICAGTGMTKSPVTVCNEIYSELRKMHRHLDKGDVMLRVNPDVVKQLKASGGKWLQEMEEIAGKTILVKSDPSLHPEQFDIQ